MKDKLNRFMQGRYGVDNFARFTLGVALFVIVVGSFMRQNAAGGVLDTVGFILIIYQREKYDGADKNTSYLYLPGLWTENSYSQRKRTEGRD